jgi:hypothetical protein
MQTKCKVKCLVAQEKGRTFAAVLLIIDFLTLNKKTVNL